jgi:hypothetical protein
MTTSKTRWLLAALAFSAISIGAALYAVYEHGEEDLYLQSVNGAGIHLKVPYRFRELSAHRQGSVLHFLAMTVPYSELVQLAKAPSNANPGGLKVEEMDFNLTIELRITGSRRMEALFADVLQRANLVEGPGDDDFDVYRHTYGTMATEYRVPRAQDKSAGQSRTILKCGPYADASRTRLLWPYCYANVQYSDRFYVIYHIPIFALTEWRSIEENVLAFIRAHTVDCFDSNPANHNIAEMTFYPCND